MCIRDSSIRLNESGDYETSDGVVSVYGKSIGITGISGTRVVFAPYDNGTTYDLLGIKLYNSKLTIDVPVEIKKRPSTSQAWSTDQAGKYIKQNSFVHISDNAS